MSKRVKIRKADIPNGVVLYQGPSMIDGKPIVVIATGVAKGSANAKTGEMIQTWILPLDINPNKAIHNGLDYSVCGDCKHRGKIVNGRNKGRSCYVLTHQAPRNVWESHTERHIYPTVAEWEALTGRNPFEGRELRIGSYGDPCAVPFEIWADILPHTIAHTGYTHQWNMRDSNGNRRFKEFASIVMASADTHQEAVLAHAYGYRTFRVTAENSRQDRQDNEIVCPASKEMNYIKTCSTCKACGGKQSVIPKSIVITVHGWGKDNNFKKAIAA